MIISIDEKKGRLCIARAAKSQKLMVREFDPIVGGLLKIEERKFPKPYENVCDDKRTTL